MEEIWKDVFGYEGLYEVSSIGRVKSVKGRWGMCFLKPQLQSNERKKRFYHYVTLFKNGEAKKRSVHTLMADAFFGLDPEKVTDHINNDPTDNRIENLQRISNRLNISKDLKGKTSKYTGVSWHKHSGRWEANIKVNGKLKRLGRFRDEEMAGLAYAAEFEKLKK